MLPKSFAHGVHRKGGSPPEDTGGEGTKGCCGVGGTQLRPSAGTRFGDENHGKIMDVGYAGCGETMQNLCFRMSPVDLGMSDNGVSLVYGNSIGKMVIHQWILMHPGCILMNQLEKTWDQDQKGPLIPVIPGTAVQLFRWSEELFFMRSKWKPLRNWNQKQDETLHKTWKACLCPHAKRCVTVWYWTSFSCNVYHTWDVFPHWQLFSVWSETITHLICVSFVESRYDTGMSLQSFLTAMIV